MHVYICTKAAEFEVEIAATLTQYGEWTREEGPYGMDFDLRLTRASGASLPKLVESYINDNLADWIIESLLESGDVAKFSSGMR